MSACTSCGKSIAASDVLYSAAGDVVCADCAAKADIVRDEGRAAGNLRKAGWTVLLFGVMAFFGPVAYIGIIEYLLIAMAVVPAILAFQGLASGNERFTKYLTPAQRTTIWITSITGLALCMMGLLGVPFVLIALFR